MQTHSTLDCIMANKQHRTLNGVGRTIPLVAQLAFLCGWAHADSSLQIHAVAKAAPAAVLVAPRETVLPWLEERFPGLFPAGQGVDGVLDGFDYRYYPVEGHAVAFANDRFWVWSSVHTQGQVVDLTSTLCELNPALCASPQPPGPVPSQGRASDCFNRALVTQGTQFRWDMQANDLPSQPRWSSVGQIHVGASFEGASGLIETRRTLTMEASGASTVQTVSDYMQLEDTPQGPILVDHGLVSQTSLAGFSSTLRTVYTPLARKYDFALAAGDRYTYSAISTDTTTMAGFSTTTTNTDTYELTYLGQTEVTVAAGTFVACHFRTVYPEGPMDGYVAKGSGLPLVITGHDEEGRRVRFEMLPSSRVNGIPVAQYHSTY
jgi:hypothetical protein